ncbi:MAG: hypothetical protein COV30_02390 [Candidatus Yanofskybacteria bacterium CG10_big_fil_rev_8_21_14_0_10_37_15]|uniref:Guanylate cyclase domain-containing protein n=1 Tax=Candidatus Yanofskybacteria bacterium CG10_big_fil_rev_8_21_14_0_10_37_15 TaxID=1975097 RepID=A0A2H0R578_9BACT|nr:MAG: hypothetical protein COV30_02390 [Candidatus Yanofskybacteria bacterium CG10_big_fil_rev_8_21_14_0_10_37_15]
MNRQTKKALFLYLSVSGAITIVFYFSLLNIWQERIFDKFFINKSAPNNIIIFAIDNESLSKIGQWPWPRKVFSEGIKKLQSSKVIAVDVNFSEPSRFGKADDNFLASSISDSNAKIILPTQINEITGETLNSLPIFQSNSSKSVVNISLEDGVARKVQNYHGELLGFGATVAQQYKNDLFIPPEIRISYAGPAKTFLTFPFSDLLENKIPERIYENKIVMIGATAPDLHDFFQTPTGLLPGVEIHANIINTLLSQNFYSDLSSPISILIILLAGLLVGIIILKTKKLSSMVLFLIILLVGINLIAAILFSFKIIIPILYLNINIIAVSIILILFQYFSESKEKKFIHDSFKYYLSPNVIDELISNPKKLQLGGERKKLAIMFSDIRGFTSISETMTPEQLTHILNEYLTEMTDIVMEHNGLVDKYIGDAVMAFWGAPLPNPNQSTDSCKSAIRMIKVLKNLNEHWKLAGITHVLSIGVGINTGEAVVGNFGSKKRFNYTILGDEVNLASRLEGLNKAYGTEIIIAESTKLEIEHDPEIKFRELDFIRVKGKKNAIKIFEVMANPPSFEILDHFNKGRQFYNQGLWEEAIKEFSFGKNSDSPSKLFLERCEGFKLAHPLSWDGIYEFKTK